MLIRYAFARVSLPSERGLSSAFADLATRSGRILWPAFASFPVLLNDALPDIDRRRIKHRLDVSGVKFLDHFDAGPAVLGDLINIGTLHQAEANVGVSQAVAGPRIAITIELQFKLTKNGI